MHDAQRNTRRGALADAVSAAGFRRIDVVRLIVGGGRTVAEATGVVHRYPLTMPVSLSTAGRLIAAGAALRIDHRTPTGRTS